MNNTAIEDPAFCVLHTMLRVGDMDRSVDFYTRLLGMRVLEQRQHKKNQFTQTYLGYCEADRGAVLELVFNWSGNEPIVLGSAFGHIAIGVYGISALCAKLTEAGVKMPRPPSTQRHGENIIAFIEDPDGYRIELVEQKRPEKTAPEREIELAEA
ncbi:MAG: lactoylglutathione lyase [Roseiarcus sp.]